MFFMLFVSHEAVSLPCKARMMIASFCLFADDNVKGFRAAVTVITVLGSLYGSRQQRVRRPSYNRFGGRQQRC